MSFPKVVIETETDSEESSSDEEDDVVEEEEEGGEEVVQPEDSEEEEEDEEKEKLAVKKTPITISLKKVCKVSFLYFSVCFVSF